MNIKEYILSYLDDNSKELNKIEKEIWEFVELGLKEFKSAKAIAKVLLKGKEYISPLPVNVTIEKILSKEK